MHIANTPPYDSSDKQKWYNDQILPMAKESIIAIVLGLVLGIAVAIAAVAYTVNIQKKQNTQIQQKASEASSPSIMVPVSIPPTVTVLQSLEISTPQSGSITPDKTIAIKGNAGQGTLIIAQSPIKTQILNTDKDTYSIDFPLALGENVITLSAYHKGAVLPVQRKLYIYRLNP